MRVLVTGGSGLVGKAVARALMTQMDFAVRTSVRNLKFSTQQSGKDAVVAGLSPKTNWSKALDEVNIVVHTAARVHVMKDKSLDPLAEFRRVNVDGTANLARQAAAAGVRRFIYLSSIKVNGEFTEIGRPFKADDLPAPKDPYGISKHDAEQLLRKIAANTGMEVVIIRPPLVYGPGVKANFELMMRWLARGVPMPLAAVTENRRSLVALDNLVDLIATCARHSAAANQIFLVSDGEDLSTAGLLNRMGAALGRPARLFFISPTLLRLVAIYLNRPNMYWRLCGSLQLDIAKTRQLLGWTPPISVDEGLKRAAEGFIQ